VKMNLRRAAAFALVWYFLFSADGTTFIQVGPFVSQSACQKYQSTLNAQFDTREVLTPCFSTTN